MTKTRAVRVLLAGFVLLAGAVTQTYAQGYTPAQMLDAKLAPKFDDVILSTPTADELAKCTVELVQGTAPKSSGWLLKDAKGQPLRRFFDSTGKGSVNIWSYYKDGVEVYREFDTASKGSPNNFRWINAGGMKWGVGSVDAKTGRGVLQGWRMISAEEVAQEAYNAVARNDFARLQLLFITESEMQALKLPAAKIKALSALQQGAQKKFAEFAQTVKLIDGKGYVEVDAPICDTTLTEAEVIKFPSRAIRYEVGKDGKDHKWIHTGEMIQVGMAWRIVDVPTDKDPRPTGGIIEPPTKVTPELQKLLEALTQLDGDQPPPAGVMAKNKKVETYLRTRIGLVQKIIPLDKEDQREGWYKQLFDNITALSQNDGDKTSIGFLKQLSEDVATKMPGTNLAAYGAYRVHWTAYAVGMAEATMPKDQAAIQEKWLENLEDFVKKYGRSEDAPEALMQLAMGCEFNGKDETAKRWYTQLHESFPKHNMAERAKGSVARLNLVGNRLDLTAPLLSDSSKTFDIRQFKDKVVIVHYWASYSNNYDADFLRLKRFMEQTGAKANVELVCINLDDNAQTAKEHVAKTQAPGIHLYQAPANNNSGGMNSPLATQYGIHILPTMFMVGRDGRVTSRTLQISDIETELKKVQ